MRPAAAIALAALALAARAAVPVRWTVETSRPAVPVFDARHGETLDLRAAFTAGGEPLPIAPNAALCWQTNGMGDAWWTAPATVASNAVSATFTPEMDPGADTVSAFLGVPGDNWRAEFRLRLRRSPGAVPNALPLPPRTIDFATVEVANAPWATAADLEAATNGLIAAETDPDFRAWRTNMNAAVGFAASSGDRAVAIGQFAQARHAHSVAIGSEVYSRGDDTVCFAATPENFWLDSVYHPGGGLGRTLQEYLDEKADAGGVYSTDAADARFYPKAEGDLWSSWWSGDGFRVTVTNYDVGANSDVAWERLPAASFDYRLAETGDHIRVWNELTRWNRFLGGYAAFTNAMNAAVASKADRAWGFYDSASGAYSPDDYLQISQPNVIIAAGMSYQKAATASGSYWVLTSTGGQTSVGGTDTNGFFRISDADGNAQIEIVRGDKRIVGADASGVEVQQVGDGRTALVVSYAITGDHPTLSMALSLESGSQWFTEDDETKPATVAWSGHSGAWTATVTPNAATSQLFARAEYAVGGDTYLRSLIPVSIPHLIIGGTKYSLGTATVDGKTVLTLTEVR